MGVSGYIFKGRPAAVLNHEVPIMVKSSREQMEQDEKKLLSELVKNSKENLDRIAKQCGFSTQKAWRIIKQLEAKGLIWGYTAVFDEEKLGLKHYMIMIKRNQKNVDENIVETIISPKWDDIIKEMKITIETSCYTHGCYDWVIMFTAENIMQAKKFSQLLSKRYPGLIQEMQILQTLKCIRKQYVLNPERTALKKLV